VSRGLPGSNSGGSYVRNAKRAAQREAALEKRTLKRSERRLRRMAKQALMNAAKGGFVGQDTRS
jgi:hypothetical protein